MQDEIKVDEIKVEEVKDTVTPPPIVQRKSTVTESEKEEFFKAFLAEKCYQEKVEMFAGKANVTVRTLTNKENSDILKQISMDVARNKGKNDDSYFITIMSYRLGLAIVELNGLPLNTSDEKEDLANGISYVSIRSKVFSEWPIFKLAAIQEAFRTFEAKVLELTMEIQNPNFWKADA